MKNKKKGLIGLVGLLSGAMIFASGFAVAKYRTEEKNVKSRAPKIETENLIAVYPSNTHLELGYDVDKNGKEDLRFVYKYLHQAPNKALIYELKKVISDLNGDGKLDYDKEVIWENGKSVKQEGPKHYKNLKPAL